MHEQKKMHEKESFLRMHNVCATFKGLKNVDFQKKGVLFLFLFLF